MGLDGGSDSFSSCSCFRCRWLYRIKPSVTHEPFYPRKPTNERLVGEFDRATTVATPTQLRWRPADVPLHPPLDFIDGLYTVCGAGSSCLRHGYAIHMSCFLSPPLPLLLILHATTS
jgi:homogentisate 1,2-dioxygenase